MTVKKRTLPSYILLNCLTMGIYGFVVAREMEREVNAICKGDGETTKFSYGGAVFFRALAPIVGIILGLILGIIGSNWYYFLGLGGYMGFMRSMSVMTVFISMTLGGVIFSIAGSAISGIYHNYWWYKQANRLKLNAGRYGITVKESGTDIFVFRTFINVVLFPISFVLIFLASLIPLIIVVLIFILAQSITGWVIGSILLFLFTLPLMLFGSELTAGATFGTHFMFKNLNRYADVYANGATPFDPMAYPYYPSAENGFSVSAPVAVDRNQQAQTGAPVQDWTDIAPEPATSGGVIMGLKGSCAGYNFEITPGEEIIIGKDAKVAMVIVDPAYKEVSRKHVGVCYDVYRDQYKVVDYSSNGTWADGNKLVPGQPVYLSHGTELKLANGKNVFRLG